MLRSPIEVGALDLKLAIFLCFIVPVSAPNCVAELRRQASEALLRPVLQCSLNQWFRTALPLTFRTINGGPPAVPRQF